MRVLITGITGMAGSHLVDFILENNSDVEIYGLCRWRSRMDNLGHLMVQGIVDTGSLERSFNPEKDRLTRLSPKKVWLIHCDLMDAAAVRKTVKAVAPDRIFHLAAQSFVPASWQAPTQTLETNIIGQVHLFEAVLADRLDPLIHVAGSSEEYGLVYPEETPAKESNPLRPMSPYGVSKVAQELLGLQYHHSYGLKVVVTRAFNHEGPRRGAVFVSSAFAEQIAVIEKTRPSPAIVWVGNLTVRRDWSDVRDVVRAYWLALEKGVPGEVYNVGSGLSRTVEDMLNTLLSLSPAKIEVRQDPNRLRPSEVMLLVADTTKLRAQTGWTPQIPFEQTMADLLDYWRERT